MPELPRISVSVKAAVLHNNQVLLLSYDDSDDGGDYHYNLPGGKAREGEPLRDAVVRKVLDETGLNVRCLRELFVVEYVPDTFGFDLGPLHKTQHNFLAEITDNNTAARMCEPRDPMQRGVEWVPLADLPDKHLLPAKGQHILDALTDQSRRDILVDRW
ncbi:NUDIX domain-containing protein [Streptomyces sp. NPDC001787]|uniref:NUDIX domain-containing protein n=1 Tax=Streptomyces sp. NPDC001787 TaxID=3154523 RepID=UPI003333D37A